MGDMFPNAVWGSTRAEFTAGARESSANITFDTVLVFVFHELEFLLANIAGRGWSIPGGRIEPGEYPEAAARREVYEETGAQIGELHVIGYYELSSQSGGAKSNRFVQVYVARAETLTPMPEGFESLGVNHIPLDRLSEIYYIWDPLIEAVCRYAHSEAHLYGWTS